MIVLSMEDTDNFSSIVDIPDHLSKEYAPLVGITQEYSTTLPFSGPHESNSGGKFT